MTLSDHLDFELGDTSAALNGGSRHRLSRLEWQSVGQEGHYTSNVMYALESYDSFDAGPYLI